METEKISPTTPRLKGEGEPVWWHHQGKKMHVWDFDPKRKILRLHSRAAHIEILPYREGWGVSWTINQSPKEYMNGRLIFTEEKLRAAFALNDAPLIFPESKWIIDQYGGDVAAQGSFIRWHSHLNIPYPGTAHDGDPNISIFISEEIFEAVQKLFSL